METILLIIVVGVIVYLVIKRSREDSESIGNWIHVFENFQYSSEEFYTTVTNILIQQDLPDVVFNSKILREGGIGSHNRLYLEISRRDHIFHICAAPFGTSFFFSWWLRKRNPGFWTKLFGKTPVLGPVITEAGEYKPYYYWDTDILFRKFVHDSVLKAIDEITQAKGIRGLTDTQRKPNMKEPVLGTA